MHILTSSVLAVALIANHVASAALRPRQTPYVVSSTLLSTTGLSKLQTLGFGSQGVSAAGLNAESSGYSSVWIGDDGPYTNTFTNASPDEVILVLWGNDPAFQASFPMAVQPLITASLETNGSITLSFESGAIGAWAGVYPDTEMTTWGQISQTWGEFTMSPTGVVDISQEVYAWGNSMSIVGPQCVSDMQTCVFKCVDPSASTCDDYGSYQLNNCAAGSQPGAQISPDGANGGCGWLGASTAALQTTFL